MESADLIAYGLIPEFIGRFPILVSLSALTEDQLMMVFLPCLCYLLIISYLIIPHFSEQFSAQRTDSACLLSGASYDNYVLSFMIYDAFYNY